MITRRETLKASVAALATAAMPVWAKETRDLRSVALPAYVEAEILKARARYLAWKGKDTTLAFAVLNDLHCGVPDIADPLDFSDKKLHQLFADRAAKLFGADFVAELGDTGCDRDVNGVYVDLATRERRLKAQDEIFAAFETPVIHCLGNHDCDSPKWKIPAAEWGRRYNAPLAKMPGVRLSKGCDYGTWDLAEKRARIVFLNTSDSLQWSAVGPEQQAWFRTALQVPDGWNVIVLSHIGLVAGMSTWLRIPVDRRSHPKRVQEPWRDEMLATLENHALAHRNVFYASVAGHTHLNDTLVRYGIPHLTSQSYGPVADFLRVDHRYEWVDLRKSLLIDVFAFKTNGETAVFRIGTGGAAFDRIVFKAC